MYAGGSSLAFLVSPIESDVGLTVALVENPLPSEGGKGEGTLGGDPSGGAAAIVLIDCGRGGAGVVAAPSTIDALATSDVL